MATLPKIITYEERIQMPATEGREEVVDGEIRRMPPNKLPHPSSTTSQPRFTLSWIALARGSLAAFSAWSFGANRSFAGHRILPSLSAQPWSSRTVSFIPRRNW